jgi:uncharacterized protein YkwD
MKKTLYRFLIVFSVLMIVSCSPESETSVQESVSLNAKTYIHSDVELDLLDEINQVRVENNLPVLEIIEHISYKSSEHNDNMIKLQDVSHDGFSNRKVNLEQVLGAYRVGENIAYGFSTNTAVINSWKSSPSHFANMKGDYSHFGLSIKVDSNGKKYYTNMFIKK